MKAKAKSFIILFSTFLLGIVLGIVMSNTFFHSNFRGRVDKLRTPEGFKAMYERILQPTETQIDTLRKILDSHFNKIKTQGEAAFHQFKILEDSLYQELKPILTQEQLQRLDEHRQRIKQHRDDPGDIKRPPR